MKKIAILLIFLLASTAFAYTTKWILENSAGEQSIISVDDDGALQVLNDGDESASKVLRAVDSNITFQAYDANLSTWAGITPHADVVTFNSASGFDAMSALLNVKKAEQTEALDNEEVLTLDQADELRVYLTCNASPTNITVAKSGNEVTGNIAHLIIVGTNQGVFDDQPGTLELDGRTVLDPGKVMTIMFVTDRWYQLGRPSGANLYIDDINLYDSTSGTYGTIQGAKKVIVASGNLNLTADQMNSDILITGGGTTTIPPGLAIDLGGAFIRCARQTTAAHYIQSNDGSDLFVLNDGTELDAGDKIGTGTSIGSRFEIVNYQANKWHVVLGTATDEGGGATCTLYDYFQGTPDASIAVGRYLYSERVGTLIIPDSSIDVCKFGFRLTSATGDLSTKDYYLELWTYTGTPPSITLASRQGVSDTFNGGSIVGNTVNVFEFTTAVSLTEPTGYIALLKVVASGAGPDADATYDGSVYCALSYDNNNSGGDTVGGLIATGGRYTFRQSDYTVTSSDATDDLGIEVYTE